MKKRFEIILLDGLWLSAIILFANFWFDIRFGFNIFSDSHWHYLAMKQLEPGRILPIFYISMGLFIAIGIIGLYFINKPRLRKIDFNAKKEIDQEKSEANNNTIPSLQPNAPDPSYSPLPPAPTLPRPPKIIGPLHTLANKIPPATMNTATVEKIDIDGQLKELFETAGYVVKQPPKINGFRLNLWAVGMDETLYIGASDPHGGEITAAEGGDSKWHSQNGDFASPVWLVNQAADKVRALFNETLDKEIQIKIKTFVVMNGAKIENRDSLEKIWNAFDVNVFESINKLGEYLKDNKNREMGSEEQEDFDAYSDYIDTVANYFNKT